MTFLLMRASADAEAKSFAQNIRPIRLDALRGSETTLGRFE
jgi:hypothetical protein